jgi:hypothetical protein
MGSWTEAAVRNNAEWCDLVCRTHGAATSFDAVAWTSATRTPNHYPELRHRDDLVEWEAVWQGNGNRRGLFKPELLDDERVTFLASYRRDRVLVGYQSGERLDHAIDNGFVTAGPLRVWVNGA